MKKFMSDFKAFINKGNVTQLAIAVVIGGAFGAIVTSFVTDIMTPLLGIILGKVDLSSLKVAIPTTADFSETAPHIIVTYGKFIQAGINFLLIALSVFLVISIGGKIMAKKAKEEAPAKPAEPSDEVKLLREIRDLLKK